MIILYWIMKKTPKTIYKIPKVTIIEKEEDAKNTIENFEPAPFIKGEDKEAKIPKIQAYKPGKDLTSTTGQKKKVNKAKEQTTMLKGIKL